MSFEANITGFTFSVLSCDGDVLIQQDADGETDTIFISPYQVEQLIEALEHAATSAKHESGGGE